VSPRATFGYRLDTGYALQAEYRFVGSTFSATDFNGFSDYHSTLDENWFDLNLASREYGPWLDFRLDWETGARIAYLTYNTRFTYPLDGFVVPAETVPTRDDRSFVGAGPHVGFGLSWSLGETGVALFTRADLGLLLGGSTEDFYGRQSNTNAVLGGRWEAGVSGTLTTHRWLRVSGGYQGEAATWWGQSFSDQGFFLRGELAF
jgi:hypothetical protein